MQTGSPAENLPPPDIENLRISLGQHPLYAALTTVEDLQFFMQRHVVCVWDFMSLLKGLQSELTTVTWPWTPPLNREAARLINEVVLGEETDEIAPGLYASHFEWYLDAMSEIGADRRPIERLIQEIRAGSHWTVALREAGLPREAREFATTTLRFASGPVHVRASAFFHGREALIPSMFITLVKGLRAQGLPCRTLDAYLERHIEVDGGEHGPMASRLLDLLIGGHPTKAAEAEQAALGSLRARHRLWDETLGALRPELTAETDDAPAAPRPSGIRSLWKTRR